ncbi:MAG: heme-binding protein [Nannocystaceae bacterium]|nr:heme-binding protein [Nannocystaceae bacterium]
MTRRTTATLLASACGLALLGSVASDAHASHRAASSAKTKSERKAAPKLVVRHALSLSAAQTAVDAVLAEAKRLGTTGVVAIVDEGGDTLALARIDGTFAAGARISTGKARTAVQFKKPTRFFEELIKKGRTPMVALDDFTPLQGGLPIVIDGEVVGGIGVSGAASAQQDEDLASAGVRALGAASALEPTAAATPTAAPEAAPKAAWLPDVLHLTHEQTDAGFAKGAPLLELQGFKIHASRRDAPGKAEVHSRDVDIFYVLDGEATVVTGGTMLEPERVGPDELRGRGIRGGKSVKLSKGDVMVIPNGTPHWFTEVDTPVTYYAVKYTVGAP